VKEKGIRRFSRKRQSHAVSVSEDQFTSLVARAKKGSVDAFQELYELYAKKILNYIYRMIGSREEAEDLTQDTFILAYRNLKSLKEDSKFQSWLYRIAQNNVYQRHRGKKPYFESIDRDDTPELSEVQRLATPQKSPQDSVLSQELEAVIGQAIRELPVKYREVFVLSAIHKLSYKEIGETVDRSPASVKSDIHRARVEVRNKIKKYLGNDYGMSDLF
jgi:RNA polymerase sigma-70 factor, ECF subfamily